MADPEKKFYGVFDTEGRATAFYISDIYPPQSNGDRNTAIPAAAVEITNEQWQELLANPQARFVDGAIVYAKPPMPGSQYSWGPTLVEVVGTG
jgi:hypothetical protein